jgi:glycosyltransferase involved in cell wall biosynthesis
MARRRWVADFPGALTLWRGRGPTLRPWFGVEATEDGAQRSDETGAAAPCFARPGAPRLVIAGRRGWQVGPLLWAIDHDPALAGLVVRIEGASDRDALALLAGARALVMPSLAEGLGLPALEAAALSVPAILSDLPALRETGGRLASYLDPMDAAAWADAIERIA